MYTKKIAQNAKDSNSHLKSAPSTSDLKIKTGLGESHVNTVKRILSEHTNGPHSVEEPSTCLLAQSMGHSKYKATGHFF